MNERTYGPAEVAAAAQVERKTFYTWMSRRVIEVRSRGTGHPRKFRFEDAVRVAAIAALDRSGIPVGIAAGLLDRLGNEFELCIRRIEAIPDQDFVLLIRGEHGYGQTVSLMDRREAALVVSRTLGSVDGGPIVHIVLDITCLVRDVRHNLDAPATASPKCVS